MGSGNSTEASKAASSAATAETDGGQGIKLYRYKQARGGGQWELLSPSADVRFYDINADTRKKAEWHLEIGTDVDVLVSNLYEVDEIQMRVTFVAKGETAYALKFPSLANLHELGNLYKSKLFENIYKLPYNSANKDKVLEKDAVLTMEGENADSQQQWSSNLVDEAPTQIRKDKAQGRAGKEVHAVRLGANDHSYLVRDKQIEVLQNAAGGVRSTGLTFDIKSSNGRQSFTPNKLLLANSESRLNMLSPDGGRNFYHTDIETGQVVSEWQFQKDGVNFSMKDLANETRSSQLEDSNILFGIGEKTLARWDMRTPEGVVQDMTSPSVVRWDAGNIYVKSPQFNCIATSGDGYIAIGSEDGCIRLYGLNTLNKAVTTIKGLGGPITAVDVTYDGKWVLATTKNYLMVVKAEFKGNNGKDTTGFKTAMGSKAPAPRLLKLKTEDQCLLKGAPLRQGRFTWVTEAGRAERWILASCGNHSVLWNFRQVKLANPSTTSYGGLTACMNYHLVEKQDQVVDSVFMHDNHAVSNECSTVVATKYQIFSLAD